MDYWKHSVEKSLSRYVSLLADWLVVARCFLWSLLINPTTFTSSALYFIFLPEVYSRLIEQKTANVLFFRLNYVLG